MITIDYGKFMKSIEESAKDKTSAEKRGEWIPTSERLPKESGIYLVTLKTDGVAHFESEFPDGFVYVSTYEAVIMNWEYGGKNVIAWMPLPEPYKEKELKIKNGDADGNASTLQPLLKSAV